VPHWWVVFLGSVLLAIGGLPIVACSTAYVLALVRVRWLKWLLALPVVAGILVAGCSVLIAVIPEGPQPASSSWWSTPLDIAALSLSGLPIVAYASALGSALVRRRWRRTGILVAGALLAAILIVAMFLSYERIMMQVIAHYNSSGWHQVILWGAYAIGVLLLLARPGRAVARFVWRLFRHGPAAIWAASGQHLRSSPGTSASPA
jgi:hypothetical protein